MLPDPARCCPGHRADDGIGCPGSPAAPGVDRAVTRERRHHAAVGVETTPAPIRPTSPGLLTGTSRQQDRQGGGVWCACPWIGSFFPGEELRRHNGFAPYW